GPPLGSGGRGGAGGGRGGGAQRRSAGRPPGSRAGWAAGWMPPAPGGYRGKRLRWPAPVRGRPAMAPAARSAPAEPAAGPGPPVVTPAAAGWAAGWRRTADGREPPLARTGSRDARHLGAARSALRRAAAPPRRPVPGP